MHVVIIGCGRVGAALTVELGRAGHSVSVIDKRGEAFDRLPPGFQARTLVGTGFDRELLEDAGIEKAGAFVAVTNGDNSNIVAARVAREHFHVPKVIARIYDPRRAEIYERLNIPTVASAMWAAEQIEYLLFHGREELKETFAGGTLLHLQREIPDHLVGHPIASVEEEGQIEVVGVDRGGRGFIPVKDSRFQQGDVAHFILLTDAVDRFDTLLEPLAE
ncbi:MAG: TrkA family potassium uptake protein [Actinomycetota bacterium]|nr:TrkA family potassium uptake protein [Actinomycetota bacterium]